MNDDFRVRARLGEPAQAGELAERLRSGSGLDDMLEDGRVIVSVDGDELFLYADSLSQAEAAGALVERLARASGWPCEVSLARWHPAAEEWEDPSVPLPASAAEEAAEHDEVVGRERAESQALGAPEYEVRVCCATHRETVQLARRLADEGIPSVRRWRYLLVGAPDEDSARALATWLVDEVPSGATVKVEASMVAVEAETPPNPFAVFGGLGG